MACLCRQEFPLLQMLGLVCSMGMIKIMQNSFFPQRENQAPKSTSFPVLTFRLSDYFPSGSLFFSFFHISVVFISQINS